MAEPDKKIHIENIRDVPDENACGFSGVYAGTAFCADALPEPDELREIIETAAARGLTFHLETPYLPESSLRRAIKLAETVASSAPGAEVIANDIGFLSLVA